MISHHRYDSKTGTFTVPSGGEGFYFFSTFLLGNWRNVAHFDMRINGDVLCSVRVDQEEQVSDFPQSSCTAAIYAEEGTYLQ